MYVYIIQSCIGLVARSSLSEYETATVPVNFEVKTFIVLVVKLKFMSSQKVPSNALGGSSF